MFMFEIGIAVIIAVVLIAAGLYRFYPRVTANVLELDKSIDHRSYQNNKTTWKNFKILERVETQEGILWKLKVEKKSKECKPDSDIIYEIDGYLFNPDGERVGCQHEDRSLLHPSILQAQFIVGKGDLNVKKTIKEIRAQVKIIGDIENEISNDSLKYSQTRHAQQ